MSRLRALALMTGLILSGGESIPGLASREAFY